MRTLRNLLILLGIVILIAGASGCQGGQTDTTGDDGSGQTGENGSGGDSSVPSGGSREVTLETSDGFTIHGYFVAASSVEPGPACLLVHQLGADLSTYADLQEALQTAGISSLAIDMRGHGNSTNDDSFSYMELTDRTWLDVKMDLEAGLEFLRNQPEVNPDRLGMIGASIGANLSVAVAADQVRDGLEAAPKALVLLSPGLMYHGIRPAERGQDLGLTPVFAIVAGDDTAIPDGTEALSNALRGCRVTRGGEYRTVSGSEHGTDMLDADPELVNDVVIWLTGIL